MSVLTSLAENTTRSTSYEAYKGGELESPFEEEVYQTLADNFGTEKLLSQVQFAGFRIDIVYDPKIDGIPKIAIECDGAKYHSSKEAYLYDRHRQKILEDHGFVFHRIWSTNWWRNANRETQKLVEFIKQTEATKSYNSEELAKTAFAFNDDIIPIESYMSQSITVEEENSMDIIASTETSLPEVPVLKKDTVKADSRVDLKYMNNGKNITVQLTTNDGVVRDSGQGTQKIHFKSPLAESLLGHAVGDIVKVGNLDNYVEILHIAN